MFSTTGQACTSDIKSDFLCGVTKRSYITFEAIYSSLSKSNFKDHYGDAAKELCLGMNEQMRLDLMFHV